MNNLRFKHIEPYLTTSGNSWSKYLSYLGLGLGILLLLSCLQLFIDLQKLVGGQSPRRDGYDYISITRDVTNETMGQPDKNIFSANDVQELAAQPAVAGVAPLIANRFQVELSAGNIIPFSTSLFVESLDNSFLDTLPPAFAWKEGQEFLPIIVSSDFLQLYNIFAPGYGLPQVSPSTASRILINVTCFGKYGEQQTFRGSIVGFSDRINSIIVPKNFLEWANNKFGHTAEVKASRLYIKTKDANDPTLLRFLDSHDYRVNKDKVKFGRVKSVLQLVVSGLGIFGLLVVILALMLFSFYLQLLIAKSKENLQLLLLLGYAPKWLTRAFAGRWVPVYMVLVFAALIITAVLQWLFYRQTLAMDTKVSPFIHWSVGLLAIVLTGLTAWSNHGLVKKQLRAMA